MQRHIPPAVLAAMLSVDDEPWGEVTSATLHRSDEPPPVPVFPGENRRERRAREAHARRLKRAEAKHAAR